MQDLLALVTSLRKLYLHFIYIHNFCIQNIAICAVPNEYNDSYCVDYNNILECNYDGGDCCQESPAAGWNDYCKICECKKTLP